MAAKNRVVGENMSRDVPQMLAVCEEHDLASIDVRHRWELPTQRFQQFETIRRIFADAGDPRTLAQIALAWIWTRSDRTIPIPGFKTVAHVKENIQAMEFGPLSDEQMKTIDEIFERPPVI
jgi:aryl-alcohol dehydrogenase-like predicted oxidoreductase